MPFDNEFIDEMNTMLDGLTDAQADILARRLSAAYMAGWVFEEGGKLTTIQQRSIRLMAASTAGSISEFNQAIGKQVAGKISDLMAAEMLNKDIAKELIPYIDDIFGKNGQVIIDHIGQTRDVFQVDKFGKISKVEKTITQTYTNNPHAYSDMLARTSTHNALEQGRAEGRQAKGKNFWIFTGPVDERSRPEHSAIIGNVYEYGTEQSDYAQEMLSEPNCRHRSIEWFDDLELDTPASHYDDMKRDAGLKFEDGKWRLPDVEL